MSLREIGVSEYGIELVLLSGSRKVIGSRADLVLLYSIFLFVVKGYEIRYNRYSGHGAEVWNLGRMAARLREYFIQWKRRWKMKGGRRGINVTIRQYCF